MANNLAKKAAAKKAAEWIENGMIVGLGTGSTTAYFIECLAEKVHKGLSIQAVASSENTKELAAQKTIPLIDLNDAPRIDITVDGADEIDPKKRMIKGGGGALVREKILAFTSKEMVVIVDMSKVVNALGKRKLPVEILTFGAPFTRKKLEQAGFQGAWRKNEQGAFYVTENGNFLFDIVFSHLLQSPEEEHTIIRNIPGVIDTGFFFGIAGRVIVGYPDGNVKILA